MGIGKKIGIGAASLMLVFGVPAVVYALFGHSGAAHSAETPAPSSQGSTDNLSVDGVAQDPISDAKGSVTSPDNSNSSSVQMTVNGQSVDVPEDGSSHQTVPNGSGGQTSVSISNQTGGTTKNTDTGNINLNISSSNSSSSSDGGRQTTRTNTTVRSTSRGTSTP